MFDFSGGVLRGLFVVISIADGDTGIFLGGLTDTGDALLKVRGVLIAGEDRNYAAAVHDFGEFIHCLLAASDIINAVGDEAFGSGCVGIERGDRYAVVDGGVDRIGQFVSVGAGDCDAFGAREYELFDGFSLFLGVFFVGGAPIDFDVKVEFGA